MVNTIHKSNPDILSKRKTYETCLGKNLAVKTSQEFKLCLDNAQPACIINLDEGEYRGPFLLRGDGVQIVGSGSGTVLRSEDDSINCFEITGSGCTISNVKITAKRFGIGVQGSNNMIKGVQFTDSKVAILIVGGHNEVDNVTMTNLDMGIVIHSDGNVISNITGDDVRYGVTIHGSNNDLTNINFRRGTGEDSYFGAILGSSQNRISNLTCTGYSRDREKLDWGLWTPPSSSSCTVVDSVCGPILVEQGKNLTLRNVHCGEFIEVYACEGAELINCCGKMIVASKTVQINNCQFDEQLISPK